jgi:hypothetical protein
MATSVDGAGMRMQTYAQLLPRRRAGQSGRRRPALSQRPKATATTTRERASAYDRTNKRCAARQCPTDAVAPTAWLASSDPPPRRAPSPVRSRASFGPPRWLRNEGDGALRATADRIQGTPLSPLRSCDRGAAGQQEQSCVVSRAGYRTADLDREIGR